MNISKGNYAVKSVFLLSHPSPDTYQHFYKYKGFTGFALIVLHKAYIMLLNLYNQK